MGIHGTHGNSRTVITSNPYELLSSHRLVLVVPPPPRRRVELVAIVRQPNRISDNSDHCFSLVFDYLCQKICERQPNKR